MSDLQKFVGGNRQDLAGDDIMVTYEGNKKETIGSIDDGFNANATFLDDNDRVLYETSVKDGETPVYQGRTPTKEDPSGIFSYTFSGWNPQVGPIYKDTSFKAEFNKEAIPLSDTILYEGSEGNYANYLFFPGFDEEGEVDSGVEVDYSYEDEEFSSDVHPFGKMDEEYYYKGGVNLWVALFSTLTKEELEKIEENKPGLAYSGKVNGTVMNVFNQVNANPSQENCILTVNTLKEHIANGTLVVWDPVPTLQNIITKDGSSYYKQTGSGMYGGIFGDINGDREDYVDLADSFCHARGMIFGSDYFSIDGDNVWESIFNPDDLTISGFRSLLSYSEFPSNVFSKMQAVYNNPTNGTESDAFDALDAFIEPRKTILDEVLNVDKTDLLQILTDLRDWQDGGKTGPKPTTEIMDSPYLVEITTDVDYYQGNFSCTASLKDGDDNYTLDISLWQIWNTQTQSYDPDQYYVSNLEYIEPEDPEDL